MYTLRAAQIAQHDPRVPREPVPARTLERRAAEPLAEGLLGHGDERLGRAGRVARRQSRVARRRGLTVPRANLLAHVTPEEPPADAGMQRFIDVAAMLD